MTYQRAGDATAFDIASCIVVQHFWLLLRYRVRLAHKHQHWRWLGSSLRSFDIYALKRLFASGIDYCECYNDGLAQMDYC